MSYVGPADAHPPALERAVGALGGLRTRQPAGDQPQPGDDQPLPVVELERLEQATDAAGDARAARGGGARR